MIGFLKVMLYIIIAYPMWVGLGMWLYASCDNQPIREDDVELGIYMPVCNIGIVIYLLLYKLFHK